MVINDFDNNGSLDQIICSYKNGVSYPVASLDQLVKQIPVLKNQYPNYSDFGEKTVNDIFGTKAVDNSILKKIVLLESCLFLNNGDGTFTTNKLPVEAQFSPVRDAFTGDFNNDKVNDLLLIGNNYSVRPSFGRYDAGYGWCLLGSKGNGFDALTPTESGFVVRGDARKIVRLNVTGKQILVIAINNGKLQIFQN
jgi:hypothetical protein